MKLIVAVVHNSSKQCVEQAMIHAGLPFTKLGSTGGFLREGNTTFLLGLEEPDLPRAMSIFKRYCCKGQRIVPVASDPDPAVGRSGPSQEPITEETGGGIAFVLNVENIERF